LIKKEGFKKLVGLLIVVLIALASCQKDDEIREPVILLEKYSRIKSHNNSIYSVFEYDKKNRVTKRLRYYIGYGEILYDTHTLIYNTDGDLVKYKIKEIIKVTEFLKNGNRISYVEWGIPIEIELNTQGLPVKKTYLHEGEIKDYYTKTIDFTWENGNLIQQEIKTYAEEYDSSITYTYDNMKSPFYNCATPKWFLMYWVGIAHCSENNIETEKHSYSTDTITYEKTYNDNGFLASRRGLNAVLAEWYHYILK